MTMDDGYRFYTQNMLSYLPKKIATRDLYHLNSTLNITELLTYGGICTECTRS